MGRKKLPEGRGRTAQIQLRVLPADKAWINAYAEARGETVSALIVALLERDAKRWGFPRPKRSDDR